LSLGEEYFGLKRKATEARGICWLLRCENDELPEPVAASKLEEAPVWVRL
jgi:hypothetical protein